MALNNADIQQQAEQRLLTALKGRSDIQQRLLAEAGELQARSTLGDEAIIGQQAYLASLGMTEEQIGRVIEASAQLSYATGMTLDSAVKNLAKTYGGLTGELGESIPKLKELTTEQLKNGEAVDFILENYKGFAEAAAETGIGPIKQLKNTWGDFLEQIGAIIMPIAAKSRRCIVFGCRRASGNGSTLAKTARFGSGRCCGHRAVVLVVGFAFEGVAAA